MNRIDAAAACLMSDDSAYAEQPDAAYRAAREMLDAADLADEESIGPRLAAARERAIAILSEPAGTARAEFIQALAAETKLPADTKLEACADRILADLYLRGCVVKRDRSEECTP